MSTALPAFHVMAKPTGAACNLDCAYCFYREKAALYPEGRFRMSDEVLETYLRQTIEAHRVPQVTIAWQGGEPTLMGLDFFRRAVEVERRYLKPGMTIENTLQTNGIVLDDEWCEFFREHGFLIGLSLDGPREMHDAYRRDHQGNGTFDRVVRAARLMQDHGVEFNILATVHAANGDHPLAFYRFFRDELEARYLQLIPIVEPSGRGDPGVTADGWSAGQRLPHGERGPDLTPAFGTPSPSLGRGKGGEVGLWDGASPRQTNDPPSHSADPAVTDRSVRPEQFGRFLIGIFDEWVRRDVGRMFVQLFDGVLASHVRGYSTLCTLQPACGEGVALEHNGDLYSCDHFVDPAHLLGNILETPLSDLVGSAQQRAFGRVKAESLPRGCRECEFSFTCHGECPKNRLLAAPDGGGLNYLCAGLKAFFRHADRPMKMMADLLRRGEYADGVMEALAAEEERMRADGAAAGRNALCPCGSGRKFKRCHGAPVRGGRPP